MNDFVDLTDILNSILDEYAYGEDGAAVVDLDSWETEDLREARDAISAALRIRDSEYYEEGLSSIDDELEEYLSL